MLQRIDLNCDLGEAENPSDSRDSRIMPHISSCNIACGAHAGSGEHMAISIRLAKKYGIRIGAHPGYPDKKNFGRIMVPMKPSELKESIRSQVLALWKIAKAEGTALSHIKPHGALYNRAVVDDETAEIICGLIQQEFPNLILFALSQSRLAKIAVERGIQTRLEVFADRAYEADGTLRSRTKEGAVHQEQNQVLKQVGELMEGMVTTYNGSRLSLPADTICLHSDSPGAVDLAKEINLELKRLGVQIEAF